MAEIQGGAIPPHMEPTPGISHVELEFLRRLAGTVQSNGTEQPRTGVLRTRVMEIRARAEGLQQAACRACAAIDAVSAMEEALTFALEAAREARHARTLPTALLERLQAEVDLAISSIDWHARGAVFGGGELFRGGEYVELEGHRVELPRLSVEHIGGNWVGSGEPWRIETGAVEYSQSIASVGTGGANSLELWPEGAAMALEAGLSQLRETRGALEGFYRSKILPAIGELAVALSNAIAAESANSGFEEAAALLEDVGRNLTDILPKSGDGKGILKLLG